MKPHEKSPEESSEDRQTEKSKTPTVIVAGGTASTNELPQAPPVAPHPPPPPTPAEDLIDGCNVRADASTATSDEDLPQAEGGVA